MGKSVFDGLLNLRLQLFSSLEKQNDALKCMANAAIGDSVDEANEWFHTAIEQTMTTHVNEALTITKLADSNHINIQLNGLNQLGESVSKAIDFVITNPDQINLSDYVDLEGSGEVFKTKWTDVLTSLKEGIDMNEFYATMNDLWMKSTNVDVSAVNGIFQSFQDQASTKLFKGDLSTIRTTLLSAAEDGKISNVTWLSYLNNLMGDSKNCVSNQESLIATSENPFAVTSFFMTVISAISTGFSYILSAIGALFGGLLGIFGLILSGILSGIKAIFNTDWTIKPESPYPGIYGTFIAGQCNAANNIYDACLNPEKLDISKIYRQELPGLDMFWYRFHDSSNDSDRIICQFQPLLNVKFEKLSVAINAHTIWSSDAHDYTIQGFDELNQNLDSTLFLSEDEYYSQFNFLSNLKKNVYASLLAALLKTVIGGVCSGPASNTLVKALLKVKDLDSTIGDNDIKNLYELALDVYGQCFGLTSVAYGSLLLTDPSRYILFKFNEDQNLIVRDAFINDGQYVSAIPTEDCVKVPDISFVGIILSVILVAGLSVAAIYGAKKFSAWMQSRKQLRQTKRMQALSAAREAYLNDPTDVTLKAQYTSELKKYNFKAKLFGWAEYDAGNAWLNDPVDSDGGNGLSGSDLLTPFYTNKLAKLINNDVDITPDL